MVAIGSKVSTKTYGNTQGRQTTAINEGPMNQSANELEKLGGNDVGSVLNKVADPNWVDPSKKLRTSGNANIDKDAFFKLMLAQLKNQDPTNPMQSHEMAAQLAQFSALEQMQNMNSTLTEMRSAQRPLENFQSLSLIGKSVDGDTAKVIRGPKDHDHDFRFQLPRDASTVSVRVRDADGNVVRTYEVKSAKAGENKITWNGEDENGRRVGEGDYEFFAEAKDAGDQKIPITTEFSGKISGVSFGAGGVVLHVGNQSIRMTDVKKITDPSAQENSAEPSQSPAVEAKAVTTMNAAVQGQPKVTQTSPNGLKVPPVAGLRKDQITETPKQLDLSKMTSAKDTKGKLDQPAKAGGKNKIMDSVGLSREMMNKIGKETKPESSSSESGDATEEKKIEAKTEKKEERIRNRLDDNIIL